MAIDELKKNMTISGFTIIKNGIKFDFPYLESYRSLLPIVDELIIAVGKSDDGTLESVQNFSQVEGQGKIKIIETIWPEKAPSGEHILSTQTNIALSHCSGDWCFYLQSDEVLHEEEHGKIRTYMKDSFSDPAVEGLLFNYHHFYGSYDIVQKTRSAYRREVRAVKKSALPKSIGDAQSFRKKTGEKLQVLLTDCHIYHYGWVRPPLIMKEKTISMDELYHGKESTKISKNNEPISHTKENYKYKRFWGLKKFTFSHPVYMKQRIINKNWNWDFENSPYIFYFRDFKKVVSDLFEKCTGIRPFEYKSYKIID